MKRSYRILVGFIAILVAVLTAACDRKAGSPDKNAPDSAKSLRPFEILIDWQAEPTYVGVYYAKSLGLFEKLGLDVKVVQGRGANQAVSAVAAGTYDIATASGGATVLGRNEGKEVISLGVLYPHISTVVYGLAKTGVSQPKDLIGKRIGIYPGSITKNEFDAFVKKTGLDSKSFEVVSLSGADIPLLKSGQVHAVLNYSEMSPVSAAIDKDIVEVNGKRIFELPLADYGVSGYGLNVVTSRKSYQADGPKLIKIAAAIFEGYRRACDEPDKALAAYTQQIPQSDPEYVRQSLSKVSKTINGNYGTQTTAGWQATIDTYKSLGLLQANVQPEDLMPN